LFIHEIGKLIKIISEKVANTISQIFVKLK